MLFFVSKPFVPNNYIHTFHYSYAEKFEETCPKLKSIYMGLIIVPATIIGLCSGGIFWGMAACLIAQAISYFSYVDFASAICSMNFGSDDINRLSTDSSNQVGFSEATETHKQATQLGWDKGTEHGRSAEKLLIKIKHSIGAWFYRSVLGDNSTLPLPQEIKDFGVHECGGNTIS